MKIVIRTLLLLSLIVWLGGEIFFPVVAGVTFTQLAPDTHAAGQIVGALLRIMHWLGLVCGVVLLALLALAPGWGLYRSRAALPAIAPVVLMMLLTAYSQFLVIPTMERDRLAAGGAIDSVPADNPARVDFERLHGRSTTVEGAVLLIGIALVVLVALAETEERHA